MPPTCTWAFNHSGQTPFATKLCILPGAPDGGPEWFGGPEPPVKLALCDECADTFVSQNGGPEKVRIEAIGIPVPEGFLFTPPQREARRF